MLLVGSEWKPSATPGIVIAALANCRPFSGRFSIRWTSTTPPTDDDPVWISGVSPETVIVSCTDASFRVRLRSSVWPTLTTMPLLSILLKPLSSARRSYVPTGSAVRRKTPALSVVSVRTKPVSVFFAVTSAPGIAAP